MDSIGVQGGSIPGLKDGGMQPVIQLGDLSKNFAAEVFERRGYYAGQTASASSGFVGLVVLESKARGGIVVEQLRGNITLAGSSGFLGFRILVSGSPPPYTPTISSDVLSIGGGEARSTVDLGHITNTWSTGTDAQQVVDGFDLQPTTIWVPPGACLTVASTSYNTSASTVGSHIEITWREIPDIQGVAS